MSLWIKICANTSLEDALIAAEAGANAVGFVFAPSPRRVTAEQVAAIIPHLPSGIEKIGVFVDSTFEEIESAVTVSGLTGVQLHSASGVEMPAQLRVRFGPWLRILRVVHFGESAREQAEAVDLDPNVDGILVDSRTATAVGGTGIAFDWNAARDAIFNANGDAKPRIAAGGLNPTNVTEAIATLRPWGVDVVSGVEAAPGKKDPAKVRMFVANARTAVLTRGREQRDIDLIIEKLTAGIPGIHVEQLKVLHPGADDDGLWFFNIPDREGQVQLESSSGNCPFVAEADFTNERFHAGSVDEAVATVKRLYGLA